MHEIKKVRPELPVVLFTAYADIELAIILITGENGTGKEVLAREIHLLSNRKYKEMIAVDMGTITASLFESELFGHVKGSFTDAHTDRIGEFEAADNSTLFLDEIGNLPYHLQAKLLTVLQRRSIVRVGSNTPIPIHIRLICAINRNLQEMVVKGEFREDLLYRINTIHVEITPADLIVYADENLISQVVINLLKNTIQAIGNQPDGKIELKASCNDMKEIWIEIKNNGPEIPSEIAEHIFIPFFTTKEGGSGIGLSISRQIMRLSGGSLTLLREKETTFILKFN